MTYFGQLPNEIPTSDVFEYMGDPGEVARSTYAATGMFGMGAGNGRGIMDWVRANPLLVGAGILAGYMFLQSQQKGRSSFAMNPRKKRRKGKRKGGKRRSSKRRRGRRR
jgi:hypothetical protein